MRFEPIAIVGQACLLPGALTPDELWRAVLAGDDLLSTVPEGHWRLDPSRVLNNGTAEAVSSTRGGYVHGFDKVFDPSGFGIPEAEVRPLDPLTQWVLHCAREALDDAGIEPHGGHTGAVVGNLSYPSHGLVELTEKVLLDLEAGARPSPVNRFMSGYPTQVLAQALDVRGPAFCLDAACASSLYAIKFACDQLHDRRADVMLAGGVNRADDLFLHTGFSVLKALSSSGQSRPFNRAADGLVPAQGAALLVLKRLPDAEAAGDRILGVIRAVGLANDGRSQGFLAPNRDGQVRAMEATYRMAGLSPGDVSLVECHATGTALGDGVELESMSRVFRGVEGLPIGSLKSNLGHLITASGAAAVIKVLAAMGAGVRPATLHADPPHLALQGSPLRLLHTAEPWDIDGAPRRAAVNNFGFGGNNAHLILEQWQVNTSTEGFTSRRPALDPDPIAVVGIGSCVGDGRSSQDFLRDLFADSGRDAGRMATNVEIELAGLRFPPKDLLKTLPQQLLLLQVVREALAQAQPLPAARTGVLVGMQCAAEIARYGLRWRMDDCRGDRLEVPSTVSLRNTQEAVMPPLEPAAVIGCMPNIVANRLNLLFDWQGQSLTTSSEELSGLSALGLGLRALRSRELDAAVVGAVDLCCEPVHEYSATTVLPENRQVAGDAALALVLKRLSDAERDGDTVFATIGECGPVDPEDRCAIDPDDIAGKLAARFGHPHAASGLQLATAAVFACATHAQPLRADGKPIPWAVTGQARQSTVKAGSFTGRALAVQISSRGTRPAFSIAQGKQRIYAFSGGDRQALLAALIRREESVDGPARLAIVASPAGLEEQLSTARDRLESHPKPDVDGAIAPEIYFREEPQGGELAFVFTGAVAAYHDMGRELMLAMPETVHRLTRRFPGLARVIEAFYRLPDDRALDPIQQLKSTAMLCQFHAELSGHALGLRPAAMLGMSSGESNALFASGAWHDMDDMFTEIEEAQLYERHLGGRWESARQAFGLEPEAELSWSNWRILAPLEQVEAELRAESRVSITIINAPGDCVIGGDNDGCQRVLRKLGANRSHRLGLDMVVHCAELAPFSATWRRIHCRRTTPVGGMRFYSNALGEAYSPDRERAADALLQQALNPVDFRRTVLKAWEDGVRVFVEQGPRNSLTLAVRQILGPREHVAVSLDRIDRSGVTQLLHAAAQLLVAGQALNFAGISERQGDPRATPAAKPSSASAGPVPGGTIRMPAHSPAPTQILTTTPGREPPAQLMSPSPQLMPASQQLGIAVDLANGAPRTSPGGPGRAVHPAVAVLHQATEVHRSFLKQQARLHREYLQIHAQLWRKRQQKPSRRPDTIEPQRPSATVDRRFSRKQLEELASGRISNVFGALFERQDEYRRQVRMPEPPLLLADRVTGLSGEPGGMGRGRVLTETDVGADAWYLQDGVMPPGIVIESGQADLLLISWLGADFLNRGERVYRLLGCELIFHEGGLPRLGDTLKFDIRIDGHAKQGELRLFFFHYDCLIDDSVRLSVRNGQAGFFNDRELSESKGVLCDPSADPPSEPASLASPPCCSTRRQFSSKHVQAYSAGDAYTCFGPGFERAASHQCTPRIGYGPMGLIEQVADFDPSGGPWGRGYLCAETRVRQDDWFFAGHFKNDPCMPGTLMADAATQTMGFYLAALGFTLDKDAWRFEPVSGEPFKFECRGQVTPSSRTLRYELFVEALIEEPHPTLYAALLCSADGLKVFHCRRFGLRLVPDYPLRTLAKAIEDRPHVVGGDVRGDYTALLACAWGAPSAAFGSMYRNFDGPRSVPRLPGPPYHFVSRIVAVDSLPRERRVGAVLSAEFDVPTEAWYFRDSTRSVMPFCVLLEAMLQPCGWFGSYMGFALDLDRDVVFRNLDGEGAVPRFEIRPDAGVLSTRVVVKRYSQLGATSIVAFRVECTIGRVPVLSFSTVFGFFDQQSLKRQTGLPSAPTLPWDHPSTYQVDFRARPDRFFAGPLRLPVPEPGPDLLMLDRITGYWPEAGAAGLGVIHGQQSIDPRAWYFKAHFYQDPVQPGSLGIEALLQLLQAYMIANGLGRDLDNPRFQAIALDRELKWTYRGQVLPSNRIVDTELEIVLVDADNERVTVSAKGSLWVDGLCIYQVQNLSMGIVGDDVGVRTASGTESDSAVGDQPLCLSVPARERLNDYWCGLLGQRHPIFEDLNYALVRQFVGAIRFANADMLAHLRERPVIFLANHQVIIESALFSYLLSAALDRPINALAMDRHRSTTWLGQMTRHMFQYPGVRNPEMLHYFNWEDPSQLLDMMVDLHSVMKERGRSLLVHCAGRMSRSCREPNESLSTVFIDLALDVGAPLVPLRFVGGLPVEPSPLKLEFPVGHARQDYHIGQPILPEQLLPLTVPQRKALVLGQINGLAVLPAEEQPGAPDPRFTAQVDALAGQLHCSRSSAVLLSALQCLDNPSAETQALLSFHAPPDDSERDWLTEFRTWILRNDHIPL